MRFVIFSLLFFSSFGLFSQNPSNPKREFRATWLATVANIDWPKTKITSPGNQTQINTQKNELITILNKLQAANMNVVFLQIRPMADALYQTQITTWSSFLTGTRGQNPGYDPLAFAIEEAHKRGMELHGWMNPYRYTSTATNHSASDYMRVQHPEWLLDFGSSGRILNPGIPAVRTHIAQVTKEVIVNYPDIDGIVWDDYFYIEAIGTGNEDADTYSNYNPEGLAIKDWRRINVNKTVKEVYDTIQAVNPGIRFGISPRGIWGVKQSDANQYGVTLPAGITGADNYNTIYCDGIAWLSQGTIDYISPQLYWATYPTGAAGQDYNKLAPWWQSVANKFGRHFYSSQGTYRAWEAEELGRQIVVNRTANDNSPGSVFYNTNTLLNPTYGYDIYLKDNYFTTQILPPAISWKSALVSAISNVVLTGNTLTWNSNHTDGSFVVFAVPDDKAPSQITGFNYMLTRHWTKTNSFDLGSFSSLKATHGFAVASVNRFAVMSEPIYEQRLYLSTENKSASPTFKVYIQDTQLFLQLDQANTVSIYSMSGILIYNSWVESALTLNLPKGVYIIRVGEQTKKVVM